MSLWQQVNERYNLLQLREKRLVFFATLALTAWVCWVALLEPAAEQWQQARLQSALVAQNNQDLERQLQQLQVQFAEDINQPLRQSIAGQQQQQAALLGQLNVYQQQFITGGQTVRMLQDLLSQLRQLQLVSLSTLGATPLRLPAQAEQSGPELYQHLTVLTVAGNFEQLMALLQQLEGLPWLLNWQQVEYQVLEHPKAQMTVFISTVSENASYIQF